MTTNTRNSLTIAETKDILCAEHAARLFIAEAWWAVVCNKDSSYAKTGDASSFWALMNATRELGQPLGYEKAQDHLGKTFSVGHNDPEKVLRNLIKIELKKAPPIMEVIEARAKYIPGSVASALFDEARAQYDAELKAEEARVNRIIKAILQQEPAMVEALGTVEIDDEVDMFDENGDLTNNIWEGNEQGGEWAIPIDRVIEFGERQLKFMASNSKIPNEIFAAEAALWEGEFSVLKAIVQQPEHEGAAPDYVAKLDDQLLGASGMAAGMNSGK